MRAMCRRARGRDTREILVIDSMETKKVGTASALAIIERISQVI